jgi:hypothetical protein
MKKLIALLVALLAALGASVAVLFFRRKNQGSLDSTWSSAKDTATSWGKTTADEAAKAGAAARSMAEDATDAASALVDQVEGAATRSESD